ncbi:guanylate kinase [Lachnospiraceae bacterium KM106-2]|nr:guanylate kinase [Lachnospiraceae bacterium KM106-2]
MAKIFVVMGKSASGKDTIFKKLAVNEELQLKTVVIYTTRPIRAGETDGVEYHFVDEARLQELEAEGKIIEHRSYNTIHGIWHYFTVADHQINLDSSNYIMIGTLEAYEQIEKYYGKDIVSPIYVEVEDGVRLQRALNREKNQIAPKYAELCRRFLADEKDFSEEELKRLQIQQKFSNIDLNQCLKEIEDYINCQINTSY